MQELKEVPKVTLLVGTEPGELGLGPPACHSEVGSMHVCYRESTLLLTECEKERNGIPSSLMMVLSILPALSHKIISVTQSPYRKHEHRKL